MCIKNQVVVPLHPRAVNLTCAVFMSVCSQTKFSNAQQ